MDLLQGIDILLEVVGRRVRRAVSTAFLLLMIAFPTAGSGLFIWYATQRAAAIQHEIEHLVPAPPIRPPSYFR